MLCHEYKCIFIHIPKAAGQSIYYFFADLLGFKWKAHAPLLLKVNSNPAIGHYHLRACEYVNHKLVDQEMFDAYFKFSFVRNPWSRIVSEYVFRGYPRKIDFKTYLFQHLPQPDRGDRYCHIMPQYQFLYDDEDRLLVDFVGKFEHLQEDFNQVCSKLGIEDSSLPHRNKLPQIYSVPKSLKSAYRRTKDLVSLRQWKCLKENTFKHYTEYYDNESIEFVEHLYRKDIEVFGYTFT